MLLYFNFNIKIVSVIKKSPRSCFSLFFFCKNGHKQKLYCMYLTNSFKMCIRHILFIEIKHPVSTNFGRRPRCSTRPLPQHNDYITYVLIALNFQPLHKNNFSNEKEILFEQHCQINMRKKIFLRSAYSYVSPSNAILCEYIDSYRLFVRFVYSSVYKMVKIRYHYLCNEIGIIDN